MRDIPSRAAVTSLVRRAMTRQAASCWYRAWDNSVKNSYVVKNVNMIIVLVVVVHLLLQFISKRVYGQICIETLHESRKRESSGLFVRISTFT